MDEVGESRTKNTRSEPDRIRNGPDVDSPAMPPAPSPLPSTLKIEGGNHMIQLTKDLAMTADEHCYIVGQPRQRADKGTILRNPTYHPTAAQAVSTALVRAMRQGVADGSITTLRQFVQEQERQRTEINKLLHQLE